MFAPPSPAFEVFPPAGCAPLEVAFNDLSQPGDGQLTQWTWGIGGACGIIVTNDPDSIPKCIYPQSDAFTISLTLIDENGCSNTVVQPEAVIVSDSPVANFDILTVEECTLPTSFEIINLSDSAGFVFKWEFDNAFFFNGFQPDELSVPENGEYVLELIAEDDVTGCSDTISKNFEVSVTPEVNFQIFPLSGCKREVFTFSDLSVAAADSIVWEFGDGFISTTPQTTHIYASEGCFSVSLKRYIGSCVYEKVFNCIEIHPNPQITFEHDKPFGCELPHEVAFSASINSGMVDSWEWAFGDGQTSQEQNPVHTYTSTGVFDASLIATSNQGCKSTIDSILVVIQEPMAALIDPFYNGCQPLEVNLEESSTALFSIVDWEWNILTDTGSLQFFEPNPQFVLSDTGQFDVTLIIQDSLGCKDTAVYPGYLEVGALPIPAFEVDPVISCVGDPVSFTDQSSENANFYLWDVNGDGNFEGFGPYFQYVYQNPGIFDVSLLVSHNGCDTLLTQVQLVEVLPPKPDFKVHRDCSKPYEVTFVNTSLEADSVAWDFGLPGSLTDTSSLDSIVFTYPETGSYTVSLTAFNFSSECQFTKTQDLEITNPEAKFDLDTLLGCAPLELFPNNNSVFAESFEWVAQGAIISNATDAAPLIQFFEGGVFEIELIIQDVNSCRDSFQQILEVSSILPEILIDSSPACVGDELILTDISQSIIGQISERSWIVGDSVFIGNDSTVAFTIDTFGLFDIVLILENNLGCQYQQVFDEAISVGNIEASFEAESFVCSSQDVGFYSDIAGDMTSVLWDFGDSYTDSVELKPLHAFENEGQYEVCLTVEDALGCIITFCDSIYVADPQANFDADSTYAFCPPLLVAFENESENAFSYQWDFGDQSGLSTLAAPSHIYVEPGSFDVQLIAIRSENCRDTLTLENFIQVEGPSGSLSAIIDTSCVPLSVDLIAQSNDAYLYIWDFDDGSSLDTSLNTSLDTLKHTYNAPGSFTPRFSMIDDAGCKVTLELEEPILLPSLEVDFLLVDTFGCGTLSIEPTNLSQSSLDINFFEWKFEGGMPAISDDIEPTVFYDSPGNFDIMLTIGNVFCRDSLKLEEAITVGEIPDIQITPDTFMCEGGLLQLKADGGLNEFSYSWDDSRPGLSCYEFCSNPIVQADSTTVYVLTVKNDGPCLGMDSVKVEVLSSYQALLPPDTVICEGDYFYLEVSDTLGVHPEWTPTDGLSCNLCYKPFVVPEQAITYTLSLVDSSGCKIRDSIFIDVFSSAEIDAGSDTSVCLGEPLILSGMGSGTVHWEPTDLVSDSTAWNPVIFPEESGTYFLRVKKGTCVQMDSVRISVVKLTSLEAADTAVCAGTLLHLSASGDADSFKWQPEELFADPFSPQPSLLVEKNYTLRLIGQRASCIPDTVDFEIMAIELPVVEPSTEIFFFEGQEIQLDATAENDDGQFSYSWEPPTGLSCDRCPDPLVSPVANISYLVTVNDELTSCSTISNIHLKWIDQCSEELIQLPNAFSPNNDGVNDHFVIPEIPAIKQINYLRIFSRWGELLFETKNINDQWDGTFRGRLMPEGVYVYLLEAPCPIGEGVIRIAGDVSIFR